MFLVGIRSVSFREDVLTIGTGGGSVHFYDLRASKYLELNCGHTCALTVGEGWLVSSFIYMIFFHYLWLILFKHRKSYAVVDPMYSLLSPKKSSATSYAENVLTVARRRLGVG